MTSEKGGKKDKNQNIQVFVRLRPLNQRERDIKSLGVVDVQHNREVVVRLSQQSSHTKKFTFDRAFGPHAKQVEVYQEVVSPLIEEVLAGYNCTVFAYGQTGTGKTHTMVGENTGDGTTWQNDPLAGIIPRALSQLFDELRISNTEYTVRVSYLELYNEELFDLLSRSEDNSKLRIYEDVSRKGSNIVNGLEEFTVYNKNEVYKIMAQGQERKKVASTLMNAQSSRSHTVFTIVVHMKENSPEGEELVKIGKLNLVDLAGSENISKAGSDNPGKKDRARECVNINQSLLTLGRVITALVERHPHIPYRESKLTRILQESLGGRTKTSIIATVSPGHKDLEETMSTLEYANRAKNIQNKPEINQKMTKKEILKNYAEEIDRLRRDLQAARDKNGVYLAAEDYTDMTLKNEEQRKEIQELLLKKRAMEEEKEKMENLFEEVKKTLIKRKSELDATKNQLICTKTKLAATNDMLRSTKQQCEEQAFLVEKHQTTEATLSSQAQQLLAVADVATNHVQCFHESMDKRRTVESINLEVTRSYCEQSSQQRAHIQDTARNVTYDLITDLNALHTALENFNTANSGSLQESNKKLETLIQNIVEALNVIKSLSSQSQQHLIEAIESHRGRVKSAVDGHQCALQAAAAALAHSAAACAGAAARRDVAARVADVLAQWYTGASARVASLQKAHTAFESRLSESESKRSEIARKHRDSRRANIERKNAKINAFIAEIEEEKEELDKRLTQQLSDVEAEREAAELRLQQWLQEERRILDQRLSKKIEEIESLRSSQHSRLSRLVQQYRALVAQHGEDCSRLDHELQEAGAAAAGAARGVAEYGADFGEGTFAITTDMEALQVNVVEVAKHVYSQLLQTLHQAREQVEKDTNLVVERDAATNVQFVQDLDAALAHLVSANKDVLEKVVNGVESNNNTAISTLTAVSESNATALAAADAHSESHRLAVAEITSKVTAYEQQLSQEVARQGELEERYLSEKYKIYSPTGKTPGRAAYRYPRHLAATSPHPRILQRFRAARVNDDDCFVVESDNESPAPGTDSETSSLSEDSAQFAAPSPPPPPPARAPPPDGTQHVGIVKSTSETDIYCIKRKQQQGKENADRSITYKKPSKLPAPASHKKPLVDRN